MIPKITTMKTYHTFEELPVWQDSRKLSILIFQAIKANKSFNAHWDLRSQLLKTAGSIMDNIAEGFERDGKGEFLQFLSIAKASAGEVRSQVIRANDFKLISVDVFKKLLALIKSISNQIKRFMDYLKGSTIKGKKYKSIAQ